MKKIILVTYALLATFSAQAGVDVCRSVLSEYLTTIRTRGPEKWSKEMEEILNQAREAQGIDAVPLSDVAALIPLFDSGIVHRAIAQELVARGHQTTRDMKDVLQAFAHIDSDKQIDFIDAVVMRLLYSVKDVSIEGEKFRQMRQDAESYHMDIETYMRFVDAWTTQRASNYLTIKLAILDNLRNPNRPMDNPVSAYGTRFGMFANKLAKEKPLVMPPSAKESTFASLILAEGEEPFPDLTSFYKAAPLVGSTIFAESHFRKFSRVQLDQLLANKDLFLSLSPEVQADVVERSKWFNELFREHAQLIQTIATLDEQIGTLTSAIEDGKATLGHSQNSEVISSAEFTVLQEMIGQIYNFNTSDAAASTVYNTLNDYSGRLNGDQYTALVQHTMNSTTKFGSSTNVIRITEYLLKFSRSVPLTDEQANSIRTSLQKRAVGFNTTNTESMNYYIRKSWGKSKSGSGNQIVVSAQTIAQYETQLKTLAEQRGQLAAKLNSAKFKLENLRDGVASATTADTESAP